MKYLKLFESHHEYYQEISFDQWPSGEVLETPERFTEEEFQKIAHIFNITVKGNKGYGGKDAGSHLWSIYNITRKYNKAVPHVHIILQDKYTYDLYIYKTPDEWYYVERISVIQDKYYKCDQFDGLLEFLKWIKSQL